MKPSGLASAFEADSDESPMWVRIPLPLPMKYLVVDNSKGWHQPMSYKDQYRLFTDKVKALEYAITLGFEDVLGSGVKDKVGMASIYRSGDIDIAIVPIVVTDDDPNTVYRKDGTPVAIRG